MYGMVNNAIRDFVIGRMDDEAWARVCERAGINDLVCDPAEAYPDAITYRLVGEAAAELECDGATFLRDLGRFWVGFALRTDFGPVLRSCGTNIRETVVALDGLHARIRESLPDLKPPSFQVRSHDAEKLDVLYHSTREGLVPFVEGLLHGLSDLHGEKISIQPMGRVAGEDFELLRVTYRT